MTEIRTSVAEA